MTVTYDNKPIWRVVLTPYPSKSYRNDVEVIVIGTIEDIPRIIHEMKFNTNRIIRIVHLGYKVYRLEGEKNDISYSSQG